MSLKTKATEQEGAREEDASGTTGYMFWETLDGFRFDTVDQITSGKVGTRHRDFNRRLVNIIGEKK